MEHLSVFSYPHWAITPISNLIAELTMGSGALASLVYCIHVVRRDRVIWPLWMFAGAGVMTIWETVVDLFEHIAYPSDGARIVLYHWLGRDIPLYCFFIYLCYFAGPGAWLYQRILEGLTKAQFIKIILVTILACATVEPILVHFDWWTYYGAHPFNWTGLPMHWWFSNATTVVFVPTACAVLRKHVLAGDAQTWIFVPFMIMACWSAKAVDLPVIFAFYATTDMLWLSLAALSTIVLALLALCGIVRAVAVDGKAPYRPNQFVASGVFQSRF